MQKIDFENLMIGFLSETNTDEEQKQLVQLLQTDEGCRATYREMTKTNAISLIPLIELEKRTNYQLLKKQMSGKQASISLFGYFYRIAAILLFMLSAGTASYYVYHDVTESADVLAYYETIVPLGSQSKVILPDSSIAWLNSGSILKYNQSFGKKTRDVYLSGEGYFEVKKDTRKPFLVHTHEIDIQVLGTIFNVRAYLEDTSTEVNLIAGCVTVSAPHTPEKRSVTLYPNEKLLYDKRSGQMTSGVGEVCKSALWTTGKLSFVNATFADIALDLQRKYDVRIQINTAKMQQEYFSGSVNLSLSLDAILSYIDVDNKYKWTRQGNIVTITDK